MSKLTFSQMELMFYHSTEEKARADIARFRMRRAQLLRAGFRQRIHTWWRCVPEVATEWTDLMAAMWGRDDELH